jgi:Pyruvate/2-oxoacid:ferredoxin oxidoreductase gamma subunit
LTGIVSRESVEEAIRTTVKPHILELNLKALDAGMQLAAENAAA